MRILADLRVGRRLIYGLIDPRQSTLFYIGKTHKRRELRLSEHIKKATDGFQTPVSVHIRDILDAVCVPQIFVLKRLSPDLDWREAERDAIRFWRTLSPNDLPTVYEAQTPKSLPVIIRSVDLKNVQKGG